MKQWHEVGETLLLLFKEIGITLFVVGSISFALELKDFTDYFLKKLEKIMISKEYLETLEEVELKRIEEVITKKLYLKDKKYHGEKTSFFNKVRHEVIPLLAGCFYEEFSTTIDCQIVGSEIHKIVQKTVTIANPNNKISSGLVPIQSSLKDINNKERNELYQILRFEINGVDKTAEVVQTLKFPDLVDDIENYTFKAVSNYEIQVGEEPVTLYWKIKTIVPISDVHYLHRVQKPCKDYDITFYLDSNDWELTGYGFGPRHPKGLQKLPLVKGIQIKFKDWILPGDGVIFTLKPKIAINNDGIDTTASNGQ